MTLSELFHEIWLARSIREAWDVRNFPDGWAFLPKENRPMVSEEVLSQLAEKCGQAEAAGPDPAFGGKRRVLVEVEVLRELIGAARAAAAARDGAKEAQPEPRARSHK